MMKYLAREKDRDIERKDKYLKLKCKILGEDCTHNHDELVGASGSMNY